ncbi:MAG: PIN domain-containing protein [Nanoarchaeota archaeon]
MRDMMTEYFFDTYAIIEIMNGNPKYEPYSLKSGKTAYVNAIELFYSVLKDQGVENAREALAAIMPLLMDADIDDIEPAMLFRHKHRDKNLSYTDCLGYILAKKHNMKFLTGDEKFKDVLNVEFVRK